MSDIKPVRHGEALLMPYKGKVSGAKYNAFIIAHSETGHHHVLESKTPFTVSEEDKQFVIELFAPAKLVHKKEIDKHNTLTITPGKYQVIKKTEYDPWDKIVRAVHD